MNELQKDGQDLRSIEKSMVDHPEQGQKLAEEFIMIKFNNILRNFIVVKDLLWKKLKK